MPKHGTQFPSLCSFSGPAVRNEFELVFPTPGCRSFSARIPCRGLNGAPRAFAGRLRREHHSTFRSTVWPLILAIPSLPLRLCRQVSSPGSMTVSTRGIHRNYVEQYASVVYRQGSCIERSFDAHFLEFVAFSFVWAESFER